MSPKDPDFIAHPPERGRRSTTLLAPGCCCCCCCCFHSLGSLAGAIYGMRRPLGSPNPALPPEEARQVQEELKAASKYAIKLYWISLLLVAIVTTLVTITENPREGVGALAIAGAIIVGFLPAGQLAASVLALIYINVFPPARKPECLRRLGRITLFSFGWGLIGAAITFLVLAGMF